MRTSPQSASKKYIEIHNKITCTHYLIPRISSMCKRGSRCLQKMSSSVSRKQQLRICLPPECSIEKKLRLVPRLAPISILNDVWRQIHVQFKNTNHSIKICMNIHTAFAPSQIIDVFHPSRKYASKTTKRYSENRCSWVKKHICWPFLWLAVNSTDNRWVMAGGDLQLRPIAKR